MDVLSDVIANMRTGRPSSARLAWRAPWAQHVASVPGSAGFQVILQGPCWLLSPDGAPLPLAVGDVVFRPHGRGHVLADSPSTPLPPGPACDPDDPVTDHPVTDHGRRDAPTTVTVCGGYRLDPTRTHPLLGDLPELVHLPAHLGRNPGLRATVDLLATELEQPRLGSDAIVLALLDTLLLQVLRAWLDQQPAPGTTMGWAAALRDPPTAAALHAMHRNPALPWTVATLAAVAGSSRTPFARRDRRPDRLRLGVRVRRRVQAAPRHRSRPVPPGGTGRRAERIRPLTRMARGVQGRRVRGIRRSGPSSAGSNHASLTSAR